IAMWGKVAVGVTALGVAFKGVQASFRNYAEDARLRGAAAGASIEGLRKATAGLVREDELLRFAGQAQHGIWKLNQEEMERVLLGARALSKHMGTELQPTI